jgi:hypothetical protein
VTKFLLPLIILVITLYSPVNAQTWTNTFLQPATYTSISGTTAVVIKNAPGVLLGVMTTGIQTNALTCYDNASAASGTIVSTGTLGVIGAGLSAIPQGGIQTVSGITCQVPTAIIGTVLIFWR